MVSQRTKSSLEKVGIALSAFGLFSILQPFSETLYRYGFQILCIGGFLYIVLGYIPAGAPISKAMAITLAIVGILVGFLILGIVIAPLLVR